jgi:hypothetical protein
MLALLLIASIGYIVSLVTSSAPAPDPENPAPVSRYDHLRPWLLAGMVPLGTLAVMGYLFWVTGFATTVQFNAGNSSQMSRWSLWVDLFPLLLILTAISGFANLIWLLRSAFTRGQRDRLPAIACSLGLSVLSFFTVATNFPSA